MPYHSTYVTVWIRVDRFPLMDSDKEKKNYFFLESPLLIRILFHFWLESIWDWKRWFWTEQFFRNFLTVLKSYFSISILVKKKTIRIFEYSGRKVVKGTLVHPKIHVQDVDPIKTIMWIGCERVSLSVECLRQNEFERYSTQCWH